jgi:hypothetical protein
MSNVHVLAQNMQEKVDARKNMLCTVCFMFYLQLLKHVLLLSLWSF